MASKPSLFPGQKSTPVSPSFLNDWPLTSCVPLRIKPVLKSSSTSPGKKSTISRKKPSSGAYTAAKTFLYFILGWMKRTSRKTIPYVTLTYDLDRSRVIDVAPDRKEASLSSLFDQTPSSQKESIQAVAVDIWDPFLNAIKQCLPQACIVHDKFHIIRHLLFAVDAVRKGEAKTHQGLLKGTKYLWLKNPQNWTPWQRDLYDALKTCELTTGKAWAYKELFQEFYSCDHEEAGRNFFTKWYEDVIQSGLKPLIKVAKMFQKYLSHIVSYLTYRITNAVAEGINSKIQQIKSAARGFRSFHNYRIAILFHCGGLNLYP